MFFIYRFSCDPKIWFIEFGVYFYFSVDSTESNAFANSIDFIYIAIDFLNNYYPKFIVDLIHTLIIK